MSYSEVRGITAGQAIMTPLEQQPQGYLANPEVTTCHLLLSERKEASAMPSIPLARPVAAKPFPSCFKVVTELFYMPMREVSEKYRDRLPFGELIRCYAKCTVRQRV